MRIVCYPYSNYYDPVNQVQFSPILLPSKGVFVGVASVSDEVAEIYRERAAYNEARAFEVLTDEELAALVATPTQPEPVTNTGDPLADLAQGEPDPAAVADLAKIGIEALKAQAAAIPIPVRANASKVEVATAILKAQAQNGAQALNAAGAPPPPPPSA